MRTALTPPPLWPTPEPGWTFVNLPMNRCTGRADRCTVDEIRDGRVIWHVGNNPDPIADTYSTPLFTFAHRMATGEYFTDREATS
ncbi:hypothetical protein ACWD26_43150 [Streptomyces sp. NPDC002787]